MDKELELGCQPRKSLFKLATSVSTVDSDHSIRKRSIWARSKSQKGHRVVSNNLLIISCRSKQKFIEFEGQNTVKINGTNSTGALGASKFNYDQVFDSNAPQSFIYEQAVKPIVMGVMEGFNGTVFAYGQTSSGKTHTMLGPNITDEAERGMIPRMVSHIFEEISNAGSEMEFQVKVSMVEIYMEKVHDLINPSA